MQVKPQITKLPPNELTSLRRQRVGIYARVSTNTDDAISSLYAQISGYNEYIMAHPNWTLVDYYIDEGISGTKDSRPEFNRLLNDCRARKLDLIITKSVSRLARNATTLISTVNELRDLNIGIIFENQGINTLDPDSSELLINVLASIAEMDSRSASENQRWKIQRSFENGIPTFFRILGYRMVNHKLQIVEAEAKIVQQIYADYLSGMGKNAIANKLNLAGYRTINNAKFTYSNVSVILSNEKYTGNLLLQKKYTPDYLTKKQYPNHGEVASYFVEASHEPIIDSETFNKVQQELARRKKLTHKNTCKGKHGGLLFTSLLTCSHCGKNYIHRYSKNLKSKKPFWCCRTYLNQGKSVCPNRPIPEEILSSIIVEALNEKLHTKKPFTPDCLTHELIEQSFSRIIINDDHTVQFWFRNGALSVKAWQHKSRKESWTPEMKERARLRKLAYDRQKEVRHA